MLGVFGPFDNPEWRFDSDKGYSESDILQLLTFNTRVSEEGFSTEGLGTQAQTILGAYLERQLEKNFIKSTGLKSSGIIEMFKFLVLQNLLIQIKVKNSVSTQD